MNKKKNYIYYEKIKKKFHDKLIEKICSNPNLIKNKINNFVYFEKYPRIGKYVPDLAFLCKTNKTESSGLYKLLILEIKCRGYGKSYWESEKKVYRILNSFIKEKKYLIKKYSDIVKNINEKELNSLYFGYRIAFENDYGGIEIVKPITWEDRDP